MTKVNIHEARTNLTELLRRVTAGEEIVISRSGKPVARLVPIQDSPKRLIGLDDGLYEVPDDFDDPLSDELVAAFEQ